MCCILKPVRIEKRYLVIQNPNSGAGKVERVTEQLNTAIHQHELDCDVWLWERPEDIGGLMQMAINANYDGIMACGGDGTLHHVATPLIGTDIPVGIVPNGSGNAVNNHLGLPKSIAQSIAMLKRPKTVTIDTGTINGDPFVAFFGIGVDAEVIHVFGNTKRRSFAKYFSTAITKYAGYRPEHIQIQTGNKSTSCQPHLFGVINGSEYGNGAVFAQGASMTDGYLDCFWVKGPPIWTAPEVIWRLFSGKMDQAQYYRRVKFKELTLQRSKSGHAQLDGEAYATGERVHIEVVPQSLKLLLPHDHTGEI